MYLPPHFAERDPAKLHAFIRQHSFGLLVSQNGGEPFATHLPLLFDPTKGEHGQLIGHLARPNTQWQHAADRPVMAVFSGPHAYVSPTWYETSNVVPTWNYVAVHVYGTFRAVLDEAEMMQIVKEYVDFYEAGMPKPWQLDIDSEFNHKMVKAIVGFRVEITRIEGKWKLNQNHPKERREKVIAALGKSDDRDSQQIAALMRDLKD